MRPLTAITFAGALIALPAAGFAQSSSTGAAVKGATGETKAPDGAAAGGSAGSAAAGGTSASTLGVGGTSASGGQYGSTLGTGGSAAAAEGKAKSRAAVHGNRNLNSQAQAQAHDGGTFSKSHTRSQVKPGEGVTSTTRSMSHVPGSKPEKSTTTTTTPPVGE